MTRGAALAILVCCSVLLASLAAARALYRYQDADGVWHFSDQAPSQAAAADVKVDILRFEDRSNRVTLKRRGSEREPQLYAINELYGPAQLELTLSDARNVSSTPALPLRQVIPARAEQVVAQLRPIDEHAGGQYTLNYRYTPGDPEASHRPEQAYLAPFPNGQSYFITQGFNGKFTHHTPDSQYAVDIALPEGTPVRAARAGTVMEMSNDFTDGGADSSKLEKANFIRILHSDGSMAVYGHLRADGAKVSLGMHVTRGQVIAESGNTGFSTGPHLHFVIQLNRDMQVVAVPFEFEGRNDKPAPPTQGQVLTAWH